MDEMKNSQGTIWGFPDATHGGFVVPITIGGRTCFLACSYPQEFQDMNIQKANGNSISLSFFMQCWVLQPL